MSRDIPKAYEPQATEERLARKWVEERLYTPEVAAKFRAPDRGVFSLAIPPPNVTGSLHMGHMLEHTQIDILMRWRRMQGYEVLWLPGTDHASIAVHVLLERDLAKQGMTRQQLGRDEFLRRAWQWKEHSGDNIKRQMVRLGASVDWTRERFTMDPGLYRAVMEAFLRLYREGLIYRGRYIVTWCPRCGTAISDLEVVHVERAGKLWHIRYPLADGSAHVTVATTRPETMLGDTAVAVHPADERYRALVGKTVRLPLLDREIPIVADAAVDMEFGSGAVKVTPAHDPNDFEIARRHGLAEIDIFDSEARVTAAGGPYAGLDRAAARQKVVEDLAARGLLEKITDHVHAVGTCQRCGTDLEPRLSVQWFCKMKPLAEPAIAAVAEGVVRITPENWERVYLDWMARIHDWCISRQLWWGHRIPVWHCAECGAMTPAPDSDVVSEAGRPRLAHPPEKCGGCGSARIEQDPDVLDTWFSSGLWPFSTLGWPDQTPDLEKFYPTSLMINGFDILFFWDARMLMMGLHLLRDTRAERERRVPFRTLYIHALVRDAEGQKMAKTRGNVLDPLVLTERHGTDAVRFALAVQAAPGTDILMSEERILGARAFANKIWNAARFIFFNLDKAEQAGLSLEELAAPEVRAEAPYAFHGRHLLPNRWIFSRLARTAAAVNEALGEFRFHEAANLVYHFFWGDFCDWYIEWVKPQLAAPDREAARATWRNLFAAFEAALRLLHPFMPFLTEELWQRLPQRADAKSIALEVFPEVEEEWFDQEAEGNVELLQGVITAARNIRAEMKLDPKRPVPAEFFTLSESLRALIREEEAIVRRMGVLSEMQFRNDHLDPVGGIIRSTPAFELAIRFGDAVDTKAEAAKLRKEIARLEADIASKRQRMGDPVFQAKAPPEIAEKLMHTIYEREREHGKLVERLRQLGE
jgi:valyl-tRNA synthetase